MRHACEKAEDKSNNKIDGVATYLKITADDEGVDPIPTPGLARLVNGGVDGIERTVTLR